MITERNSVIKIKTNLSGSGVVYIECEKKIFGAVFAVSQPSGEVFDVGLSTENNKAVGEFTVKNPEPWNIEFPVLYSFSAMITTEDGIEKAEGKFAFRTITSNGKNICINGTPVFIRGYIRGATAHEHQNDANLTEEEFYRKNITQAKKFGFNTVRFHSVVPNETFLGLADELGMLVHIELRPPHDIYNNLEEMVTTGNAIVPDDFLAEVVNKGYNHPSLAVYCIGNEIKNAPAGTIRAIKKKIDVLDGTRLFLDTCAWGENGRPDIDIDVQHLSYYFPFGKHAKMYDDTDNLLVVDNSATKPMKTCGKNAQITRTSHFSVPLIAHEVCHYTALRDFDGLKKKFSEYGTPVPWWIDEELKIIKEKGYSGRYAEMYKASKRFQSECWKTAFEAMRSSKLLGGFHFLQFADTDVYENSNGVVDCFDDESYVTPEFFLKFNGDRVLLTDLGYRLFYAGDEITLPVNLSNCGDDAEKSALFRFTLIRENGEICALGEMPEVDIKEKGVYEICKIKIRLPEVKKSEKLTLKVKLFAKDKIYSENEWELWVYEKEKPISYKEFVTYESGDAVITDDVEKAFESIEKGKNVCLVYRSEWTRHVADKAQKNPKYAFKATWNRFKPVIWDRGTNYGGLCNAELLGRYGFASDKYYGFNYSVISEDCDKIILDDFPVATETVVSGIDKSCRDRFDAYKGSFNLPEIMPDRTLRDFGYLFSFGVGNGKLLVCGFNLTGMDKNEPSSAAMAKFIKDYIRSEDFAPKNKLTLTELKRYMEKCASSPVKERMMTQFWELDDAPVESPSFWKESREYLINNNAYENNSSDL